MLTSVKLANDSTGIDINFIMVWIEIICFFMRIDCSQSGT